MEGYFHKNYFVWVLSPENSFSVLSKYNGIKVDFSGWLKLILIQVELILNLPL